MTAPSISATAWPPSGSSRAGSRQLRSRLPGATAARICPWSRRQQTSVRWPGAATAPRPQPRRKECMSASPMDRGSVLRPSMSGAWCGGRATSAGWRMTRTVGSWSPRRRAWRAAAKTAGSSSPVPRGFPWPISPWWPRPPTARCGSGRRSARWSGRAPAFATGRAQAGCPAMSSTTSSSRPTAMSSSPPTVAPAGSRRGLRRLPRRRGTMKRSSTSRSPARSTDSWPRPISMSPATPRRRAASTATTTDSGPRCTARRSASPTPTTARPTRSGGPTGPFGR